MSEAPAILGLVGSTGSAIAIVKADRWKVWHYRGLPLCYVICNYGGDAPYLRLFEDRKSFNYYLKRAARWGGRILGRGLVTYYPDHQPEPNRSTRVQRIP